MAEQRRRRGFSVVFLFVVAALLAILLLLQVAGSAGFRQAGTTLSCHHLNHGRNDTVSLPEVLHWAGALTASLQFSNNTVGAERPQPLERTTSVQFKAEGEQQVAAARFSAGFRAHMLPSPPPSGVSTSSALSESP